MLKTTSQYTKILRHLAAQLLISSDQLYYLDRTVRENGRTDESKIVRQLVLEYSTATRDDHKSRLYKQLLDCIPPFDVRLACYFPFPVRITTLPYQYVWPV